MKLLRRLLVLGFFAAALVVGWRFAATNGGLVTVDLLMVQATDVAMWVVLGVTFGAGAALTAVFAMLRLARVSLESRRYRRFAAKLEAEIHQLRNLPLVAESASPTLRAASFDPPERAAGGGG